MGKDGISLVVRALVALTLLLLPTNTQKELNKYPKTWTGM